MRRFRYAGTRGEAVGVDGALGVIRECARGEGEAEGTLGFAFGEHRVEGAVGAAASAVGAASAASAEGKVE